MVENLGFGLMRTTGIVTICGVVTSGILAVAGKSHYVIGLSAGCITFILYYMLLTYQMRRGASMEKEQAIQYLKAGWLSRFSLVISIALLAVQTEGIHMGALLAGFFLSFRFVACINAVVLLRQSFITDSGRKSAKGAGIGFHGFVLAVTLQEYSELNSPQLEFF